MHSSRSGSTSIITLARSGSRHRSIFARLSSRIARLARSRKHGLRESSHPSPMRHLPTEIWGMIIKHACIAHRDPLDTTHELSFLEEASTLLDTYMAAMADKMSYSLVSKEWNVYAREYVYEFIWIRSASQAKVLAHLLILQSLQTGDVSYGSYIRRLHIETPVFERCAPADLRSILENAPRLCIFSDHHSVRRSLYDDGSDPRCTSAAILKLVAQQNIRRLSWTSYADTPFQRPMAPLWTNLAAQLEYLELSFYSPKLHGSSPVHTQGNSSGVELNVSLPCLRALKVSLDNDTFTVLSSWDMPQLTHLSVLSSDFSYTGPGFASFFRAHGTKLTQLELGHSSSLIEEHYLTAPPAARANPPQSQRVSLAKWCPNLREFICSADAEWHWQSPDWIPAHVLLPSHPRVELIGIRNVDVRLREDPDISGEPYFTLLEQLSSLLQADAFPNLRFVRDMSAASDAMRSQRPSPRVTRFWQRVVDRCSARCVWLEDCRGVNVTQRSLLRAAAQLPTKEDDSGSYWSHPSPVILG